MAEQSGGPPADVPPELPAPSAWVGGALVDYIDENLDTYTPAGLEATLVAAGHDPDTVRAAFERARARRAAGPVKTQALLILVLAYALTYVVFVLGLLEANLGYGASGIAAVVLTVVMVLAFGASMLLIRRRGAPLTLLPLVAVPLLILVAVAGACYATTGGAPVEYLRRLIDGASNAPSGP